MEDLKNICCGYKHGHILMGVLVAVLAVYVAVLAANAIKANKYIGRDTAAQSTITVSGTGDVSIKPDLAVINFSVVSNAKTVVEATTKNTKDMNAIVNVAKSLGVEDKDLQTTGYSINPQYNYVDEPVPSVQCAGGMCPVAAAGKRILSGYDVTQTLTVKMRDMSKIGQIIEEATASGANQVGDLQFTIDNPEVAQADARKIAIDDAKAKAQKLASQMEVKLGRITGYSEGGYYPMAQLNYAAKDMAAGSGTAAVPNIQTGENKVTSNVNIVYEIE